VFRTPSHRGRQHARLGGGVGGTGGPRRRARLARRGRGHRWPRAPRLQAQAPPVDRCPRPCARRAERPV